MLKVFLLFLLTSKQLYYHYQQMISNIKRCYALKKSHIVYYILTSVESKFNKH